MLSLPHWTPFQAHCSLLKTSVASWNLLDSSHFLLPLYLGLYKDCWDPRSPFFTCQPETLHLSQYSVSLPCAGCARVTPVPSSPLLLPRCAHYMWACHKSEWQLVWMERRLDLQNNLHYFHEWSKPTGKNLPGRSCRQSQKWNYVTPRWGRARLAGVHKKRAWGVACPTTGANCLLQLLKELSKERRYCSSSKLSLPVYIWRRLWAVACQVEAGQDG